jgi:hypothetical protein
MMQANSALTPTQIYGDLRSSASPMPVGTVSPNNYSGWGFVQADMALAAAGGPSSSSSSSSGGSSTSSGGSTSSSGGDSGSGGSSKGGGGAFDVFALMSLAALALARRGRRGHRRCAEDHEIQTHERRIPNFSEAAPNCRDAVATRRVSTPIN